MATYNCTLYMLDFETKADFNKHHKPTEHVSRTLFSAYYTAQVRGISASEEFRLSALVLDGQRGNTGNDFGCRQNTRGKISVLRIIKKRVLKAGFFPTAVGFGKCHKMMRLVSTKRKPETAVKAKLGLLLFGTEDTLVLRPLRLTNSPH